MTFDLDRFAQQRANLSNIISYLQTIVNDAHPSQESFNTTEFEDADPESLLMWNQAYNLLKQIARDKSTSQADLVRARVVLQQGQLVSEANYLDPVPSSSSSTPAKEISEASASSSSSVLQSSTLDLQHTDEGGMVPFFKSAAVVSPPLEVSRSRHEDHISISSDAMDDMNSSS